MATVIAIAFGLLFIYAIHLIVEKRKTTVKKTNFKDGETPKQDKNK